jgi:UDP-N-acetyl-D-glucosamine dehydrogenase
MESVDLNESTVKNYDCVVIATDHSSYDYDWIVRKSLLIVDTRGATCSMDSEKVVMA